MQVRKELFERDQAGWQCCVLACAEFESQTTSMAKSCEVVEMRNSADAVGYPCSRTISAQSARRL
jgi:hypothetical protein